MIERLAVDTAAPKVAEIIERDGAIVIEGLVSSADTARIACDVDPAAFLRQPGFVEGHDDFYGSQTIRMQALARRSPTFVEKILVHPLLLATADHFLLPACGAYHLSQAELIYLGPGQAAQPLHSDDANWPIAARIPDIHLQLACLVALGDYDTEVGATRVIPASHDWPFDLESSDENAESVPLEPGDALVYLGSTRHGGGENRTADRWRKALYVSYLLGWLTPEEAVPMGIDSATVKQLPARARQLLGHDFIPSQQSYDVAESALQLWQLDADDLA